jgi:hypothetical protein
MCGDGKYWRPMIYKLALAARRNLGVKGVLCCTERNPVMYMRVLGGTLRRMEHTYDFATGKSNTLWFIFITPEDTKERGREKNDPNDSSDNADTAVGSTCD